MLNQNMRRAENDREEIENTRVRCLKHENTRDFALCARDAIVAMDNTGSRALAKLAGGAEEAESAD